jgi:hypothetical protein
VTRRPARARNSERKVDGMWKYLFWGGCAMLGLGLVLTAIGMATGDIVAPDRPTVVTFGPPILVVGLLLAVATRGKAKE